jgi:hypothetical protein
MIRSKLGLKALGMCALVFGMMAVWAGAAQAEETGGKWTYETGGVLKTFEGALAEPEVSGKMETGTVGILHTKVLGGSSLLYECKAFTVNSGKLKANGVVLGKLTFTECEAFLNSVLSKPCNPIGGTIETNLIKGQMLLHKLSGGAIDKILIATPENAAGETITNFAVVKSEESCSFGASTPIGGKFAIQTNTTAEATEHLVNHLIKEFAPLSHLFVISDTAEHAATILGSAEAFLKGAHANFKWAGLWN